MVVLPSVDVSMVCTTQQNSYDTAGCRPGSQDRFEVQPSGSRDGGRLPRHALRRSSGRPPSLYAADVATALDLLAGGDRVRARLSSDLAGPERHTEGFGLHDGGSSGLPEEPDPIPLPSK
jgi:hypothetical protein